MARWLPILFFLLGAVSTQATNSPPFAPVILEPSVDDLILNPADVHMATGDMVDPDVGDTHACSDFQIWTVLSPELVWDAPCISDLNKVHAHFGDGSFVNSYAGRDALESDTDYEFRVRHFDSATNSSPFSIRPFRTGPPSGVFPLTLEDVLASPVPQWTDTSGVPIELPVATNPAVLRVESPTGELLLQFSTGQSISNPPSLADHADVRVQLYAGHPGDPLSLPESRITLHNDHGDLHTIYLPPIDLAENDSAFFWISENGSSYEGSAAQTNPVFATLVAGAPVPWTAQTGFKVEVVATGFQLPVNIAFVPAPGTNATDPHFYVSELYGAIKVVLRDGTVLNYATNLLNFNPTGDFPGSGEQGVTGVAVDPASGDVFASMLYDAGPHYAKVVRFHSTNGGQSADTQTTILDMAGEEQNESHQVSNLTIGPDGKLYVHNGDGFSTSSAQNTNQFRGKILRMNLDGSAPADNPMYNAANGTSATDYIYAYGFRNPFGGAWRNSDERHYEVENGPTVDRLARVLPGVNYGWNGSDSSMYNFAFYNWPSAHAPVNLAFVQTNDFGGSGFPSNKMDRLYVTESGPTWATGPQTLGKRIVEFSITTNAVLTSGPITFVEYNGSGKATAAALAAGPDGLYFSDLYKDTDYVSPIDRGANILRIRFVGAIDFGANIVAGPPPLAVQFTNTSTAASATGWHWDFGDGQHSVDQHPLHLYADPGIYDVTLQATGTNATGQTLKKSFVHVGNFGSSLFVVGNTGLSVADSAVRNRLQFLGFAPVVVVLDSAATSAGATGKHVVVISQTVASTSVNTKFRNVNVPVVNWEQNTFDDMQLTGPNEGTHHGITTTQTQIRMTNESHFLAAGLTSLVQVASNTTAFSWGVPTTNAIRVAVDATDSARQTLFAYETGALMNSGLAAPARRVGFFPGDLTPAQFNSNGWALFDAAIRWSAGHENDVDSDGLADAWETEHFGNLAAASAQTESDGDGVRDANEFIAGTSPTNAASFFQASGAAADAGLRFVISWTSESNRLYEIERATNLIDAFVPIASNIPATPPINAYTDSPPDADAIFHRILVRP